MILTAICGNCRRPCAEPDSIEIDPLCTLCIARMQGDTATTIEDCGHILTNAMQDAAGVWYCLHRAHTKPALIVLDPIAHPSFN